MATQPEFVEQLFEVALALEPAEREAYLDQACSHDPELRRTVEDLLAEDANAGSLLEHPPFECLGPAVMGPPRASGTTGPIDDNEIASRSTGGRLQPGRVLIDRFVIVRFIAKGGMGEVYEAEDRFLQGVHVAVKTILPQSPMSPPCGNGSSAKCYLPGRLATRIFAPSTTSFAVSSRQVTSCS